MVTGGFIGLRGANAHWDLRFWGRNLFDQTYCINASIETATTYTAGVSLGAPRFYGATLQFVP